MKQNSFSKAYYLKHLLLLVVLFIIVVFVWRQCASIGSKDIDFLINNEDLESLYFDFSEDEYALYANDPSKVFFSQLNKPVEFLDISEDLPEDSREWLLDFQGDTTVLSHSKRLKYVFRTPGLYKVSLQYKKNLTVTKLVRVVGKKESLNKNDSNDIGAFNVFDFTISNDNPAKWEAIIFEDVSQTNQKIEHRLWDFGDGTIIPTKGKKVRYSYAKLGVYEVKLCVNRTNNCKRKRIVVAKENDAAAGIYNANIWTKQSPQKKYGTSKKQRTKKPMLSKDVHMDLPNQASAGLPVRFRDLSAPQAAIYARTWYIDGVKQYFERKNVNYIFDTPGTYEIKMCLNRKRDLCISKKINVYLNPKSKETLDLADDASTKKTQDKSKPFQPTYIPYPPVPNDDFICSSYGRVGLKSKYRCTETKSFYTGNAAVRIAPKRDVELQNAEIYGEDIGFIDVFILNDKEEELAKIHNVQVLPGYSTIEFGDAPMILEKNKSYTILIKASPYKRHVVALENGASCFIPSYKSKDVEIEYLGNVKLIYDLKFCL